MRTLLPLLMLACSPLFGANGLVCTESTTASYSFPYSAPFTSTGLPFRFQARVNTVTFPASGYPLVWSWSGDLFNLLLTSDGKFGFQDWADSITGGGTQLQLSPGSFTDVVVVLQRDTANMRMTLEIWDTQSSGYLSATVGLDSLGSQTLYGYGTSAPCHANATVSNAKLFSVVQPLGTPPSTATGDYFNWVLNSSLTDTGPYTLTLTDATASYSSVPSRAPIARAGADQSVKSSTAGTASAVGSWSPNGASLTYTWTQTSGSCTSLSGTSTVTLSFTSASAFGECVFQVAVDDGTSSTDSTSAGVVVLDANNVVQYPSSTITQIFLPQIHYGNSVWPYLDNRNAFMADFFGGSLATEARYQNTWDTALGGTIAFSSAGSSITGTGTNFRGDFCDGSGNPLVSSVTAIIPWVTISGKLMKKFFEVASCADDTHMTVYGALPSTETSVQYAVNLTYNSWVNGSENNNYYDVVLAHYALYYRTGLTKYRDYARTLAERWWSNPGIYKGRVCLLGYGAFGSCPPPRVRALTGVMWWLYETSGDWADMYTFLTDYVLPNEVAIVTTIADDREAGYSLMQIATAALLGDNPTTNATYASAASTSVDARWVPQMNASGGGVESLSYGCSSWNSLSGTLHVTNGSPIVTNVSGINFNTLCGYSIDEYPFWVPNDTGAYRVASVDSSTQITLHTNYAGTTRDSDAWQWNVLVGYGYAPFTRGIPSRAMYYTYLASGNTNARNFVISIGQWLASNGINDTGKGLFYGYYFYNCEPDPNTEPECRGDGRFLQSEVIAALSLSYTLSPNTTVHNAADQLVGAMLGTSGGPDTDGISAGEFDTTDITTYQKAKNYGFPFGMGGTATWDAARLSLATPSTLGSSRKGNTAAKGPVVIR